MATKSFEIKGLDEIKEALHGMDEKLNKKIIEKTFRKAAKPLIVKAKLLAPKKSGKLRRSIGSFTSRGRSGTRNYRAGLWVGPRTRGKNIGFHAHFVEFGTEERILKKSRYMVFSHNGRSVNVYAKTTGKMPAKPFMEPAYEQSKVNMEKEMIKEFSGVLEKELKKHGKKVK